jgi:cytochrome c
MKRILAFSSLILILASCGGNNSNGNTSAPATDTTSAAASNDITKNPDYQKGFALVSKNNCFTCHKIDEKLIGPAYRDVAKKYAGNDTAVAYLAKKVITGGKGVWGEVPMTPHPDLSMADAEQMVKYILLLKNQ